MKKVTDKEQMISLIKKDNTLNSISDDVIMLAPTILTKSSLKYASSELCDDEEIVRLAIKRSYDALKYASKRLRDDEEIVRLAIERSYGKTLKYASKRLRDDEEIVRLAIEESYGLALCYASPRLKYKDNMIKQAIESPDVFPVGNFELYFLQNRAYIIGVLKEFVKGRENEPKHKRKKCKVLIKKH